jgi:hypothetical protein
MAHTPLERIGGRAASYAELCRSHETEELLRAWENEDPAAWPQFRELLEGSGLERPTRTCSPGARRWGTWKRALASR